MAMVICPFCQEKGRIPASFFGKRIKCARCNNRFLVTPPPPRAADPFEPEAADRVAAPGPRGGIAVEGLDDSSWRSFTVAPTEVHSQAATDQPDHESHGVFTESHADHPEGLKEYKLLTQKDKWFDGKFDLPRLEEALNHFAKQGWRVVNMTTAHIAGFSGGAKEEIVVLLER